jgi:hypothetical protein
MVVGRNDLANRLVNIVVLIKNIIRKIITVEVAEVIRVKPVADCFCND